MHFITTRSTTNLVRFDYQFNLMQYNTMQRNAIHHDNFVYYFIVQVYSITHVMKLNYLHVVMRYEIRKMNLNFFCGRFDQYK